MIRHAVIVVGLLVGTAVAGPGAVPEGSSLSEDAWDFLDLRGDAAIYPATDWTCPPGYGPNVLHIEGELVLAMVKGATCSAGTLVALYRENSPRERDADGVLLFRAAYPMDVSVAHNVKEVRSHVWLEQDNDAGFQIRAWGADGHETTLAERAGYGLVTDGWNKTRWIWQKVQLDGNRVRAKYWPAHRPEPDEWAIEAACDTVGDRCGIKINSGNIQLAYFAVETDDSPIKAPPAYLMFPFDRVADTRAIELALFTNARQETHETFDVTVTSSERELGRARLSWTIPAGPGEFPLRLTTSGDGAAEGQVVLSEEPPPGPCHVTLSSASGGFDAECRFDVMPVAHVQARFDRIETFVGRLADVLPGERPETAKAAALAVIRDAARAHFDHARARFRQGSVEAAERSLGFAEEALAELAGHKGAWLRALAPDIDLAPRLKTSDTLSGDAAPENHEADWYSKDSLLTFGEAQVEADSLVMGRAYDVVIPWILEGQALDKDFSFHVRLVSPLGDRVVAQADTPPDTPSIQWTPGTVYRQQLTLRVSPEDPGTPENPLAAPAVLDERHRLVVTVVDPETGAKVILGNAPGPQPDRVGHSFHVRDLYVSSTPIEVRGFRPADAPVLTPRTDRALIRNVGDAAFDGLALLTVRTETGRVAFQQAEPVRLGAGAEQAVAFTWTPTAAGRLTVQLQVRQGGTTRTEVRRDVRSEPPAGYDVRVVKDNHVTAQGDTFVTPIAVSAGAAARGFTVQVHAAGRLVGAADTDGVTAVVEAEPWFGYYDVTVDLATFTHETRLVATVVETDGMDLLVNGEPFIVKGVNVHGMDASSPARTASMMRIMRDLGFNVWRGDYPPAWQVDLAYELNTAYTVLAPFSCASTTEIFARQAGPPMTTSRELSRLFVERYRDSAGVLLWNSCNEIGGDNVDFLLSQYPVYKAYDPYARPVHYANLYGQDLHQGQDVMGINTYFALNQTAASRHPVVQRSIDVARAHAMPVLYCEFNSYIGAVHSTGADAMDGLFAWGVDQGMCGGVQYMRFNSSSHPGIIDNGYNTHKIYDDAIIHALADAEVACQETTDGGLRLRVRNKRRCTLRHVTLEAAVSGVTLPPRTLDDVAPQATVDLEVALPAAAPGPTLTVDGTLTFVTHFGFRSRVPIDLVVPGVRS